MANGYFERGEMYDILFGDGLAGEMVAHRPGIIVSSDKGNTSCPTVLMVYTTTTTTQNKRIGINHEFVMNGWTNFALCNQIATINKSRLKKFYGKLSDGDMRAIDTCLEEVFDLGYVDDIALKEKDSEIADREVLISDLKSELAGAVSEIGKRNEEIASLKMEIEMWQKCYGRCMDMLVDTKVNGDFQRRTVVAAPIAPVVPSEQPKKVVAPKPVEKVELNSCTETDLRKCGCTDAQARLIKAHGAYSAVDELLSVPGVTSALFVILKDKVYCEPPKQPESLEDDRLDINSCTATALKNVGFSLAVARKIIEGRPFENVEDLKRVNGLKASLYRIVAPKLRCVPVVEVEGDTAPVEEIEVPKTASATAKVNVNTVATASELTKLTGMCSRTTNGIIKYRKEHGKFESLEDLLKTPAFGDIAMKRYGHLLEV